MATQEQIIFSDDGTGAQVAFVWDDVANTVSGLHLLSGTAHLTATAVVSGNTISRTLPPNSDVIAPLPGNLVTIGTNPRSGARTFVVNGVTSYGFSVA